LFLRLLTFHSPQDKFFPEEDEAQETGIGAPQVDAAGSFAFQSDLAAPQGGFSFGGNMQ
jgi:importin subunit alpha-6/7